MFYFRFLLIILFNFFDRRPSRDSIASTQGGSKTGRKEIRPVTDPAFKNQCVNRILEFLLSKNCHLKLNKRSLLTPTTRDFADVFTVSLFSVI